MNATMCARPACFGKTRHVAYVGTNVDLAFWLGAIVGAVLGMVFGVIGTVFIQPSVERLKRKSAQRLGSARNERLAQARAYDLQPHGFYQIKSWSERHPLDPRRHRVEVDPTPRAEQQWLQDEVLAEETTRFRDRTDGEVVEISRVTMDYGETDDSSKGFVVHVRPSGYPESLAFVHLLKDDALWDSSRTLIEAEGILDALKSAPPQSFFLMLTLSTQREVLALRRSAATVSAAGIWALGACETMKPVPIRPGEAPEDFFDLGRRAAMEEFGLHRSQYGPIWFTWYGFGRDHGQFAVAHIRTSLTVEEVEQHLDRAEGGYEADARRWIPLAGQEHRSLADLAVQRDRWLPLTPIAAQGLLSVASCINEQPVRR